MNARLFSWGLAALACLASCGDSGPPIGLVEGTITLDGQPLEEAMVTFEPVGIDGSPSYGTKKTDALGHYVMQYKVDQLGVLPGKHHVRISTYHSMVANVIPERVPLRYNANTELERKVVEGKQTIDFDLKSK